MQRREKLIVEHERLVGGYKDRSSGRYTPGLRDIEAEVEKTEQNLFNLKIEQETKVADAFKEGKNADKIIADFRKKLDSEKSKLETLQLKRKGLSEAIKVKEKEFKGWELHKLKQEEENLGPRFLKAVKDRDAKEKELETAQAEVTNVQFLKLSTREKIVSLEKQLAETVPPLSREQKEEQRERADYERRCEHVFRQIDDEILLLLNYETDHTRRLGKLKTLRSGQAGMIKKIPFPWPLERPESRPDPFEGFRDEDIARVSYKDAVTLRHGSPEEREKVRKKYL
jgi:hypothetical protein